MTTKDNSQPAELKSGIITLVGRSNVGKSTLLNTLIGTKVAIVTDKPQTTRHIIHGVLNAPQGQAVFVDTPGIFKQSSLLAGKLTKKVQEAIKDIDIVVYVVDPSKSIGAEERFNLSLVRQLTVPKIMAINKSDLPIDEKLYLDDYRELSENFDAVFELSALNNSHVQPLRDKVFELLPSGPALYPVEQITNIDPKFWVAEIIREKIFLALRKEVPYTTHVDVISIEEKDAKTKDDSGLYIIKAIIYTNEARYKKMIIGAGGRSIKEIGIAARKELEAALNKKVFLELEVETDKHWEEKI